MGRMQFFPRPKKDTVDDYRASTGRRDKVLAFASGPRIEMLAFTGHFSYRFNDQSWESVGWHEVYTGGWRADGQEMHWRLVDGHKEAFQLADEGQFPEVFRERVQASVALEQSFEVPVRGDIIISARRDLANASNEFIWHVRAVRGARLDDAETMALARRLEASLRADYDL